MKGRTDTNTRNPIFKTLCVIGIGRRSIVIYFLLLFRTLKIKIRRIPPPEPCRGLKEETDLPPPAPGKEEIAITPPKPKIGHLKDVIIGIKTIITPMKNKHQKAAGTLGICGENFGTPPNPSMGLTKEQCVDVVALMPLVTPL